MGRREELQDVQAMLKHTQRTVDTILEKTASAKSWGLWDILGGGCMSSLIKRDKIDEIEEQLELLKFQLSKLTKEMAEADLKANPTLSNRTYDFIVDIWFDNALTDFRVQSELSDLQEELRSLSDKLSILNRQVKAELEREI